MSSWLRYVCKTVYLKCLKRNILQRLEALVKFAVYILQQVFDRPKDRIVALTGKATQLKV